MELAVGAIIKLKTINLAVAQDGIAIPLFFLFLRGNKHGYKPRGIIRYGLNQLKKAIALLSRTKRPFRRIISQIFGPIRLNFEKIVL